MDSITYGEKTIIGCLYLFLSICILPVQIGFIIVFLKYREYRTRIAFNIMLCIAVCETMQLFSHIYTGIIILLEIPYGEYLIEDFAADLYMFGWLSMVPLSLVLALNRFIVMQTKVHSAHKKLFRGLICCCFGFGGIFIAIYLTKKAAMVFDENYLYWSYSNAEWSVVVQKVDYFSVIIFTALTFVIHVGNVMSIALMRTTFTSKKGIFDKHELKLLFQSFLIFAYIVFLQVLWSSFSLLPNFPWSGVATNVLDLGICGLNPLLYFTMNPPLKRRFLQLFGFGKNATIAVFSNRSIFHRNTAVVPSLIKLT